MLEWQKNLRELGGQLLLAVLGLRGLCSAVFPPCVIDSLLVRVLQLLYRVGVSRLWRVHVAGFVKAHLCFQRYCHFTVKNTPNPKAEP